MSAIEGAFCRSAPWRWFARRTVLPWALRGQQLHGQVLEIGGGSGAMAGGVTSLFPDAFLTVTDMDEAMVAAAQLRLSDTYENVTVRRADVTALPFDSGSFDFVTSYLMLHHVIDWPAALDEVARVLRPGGVFVGYDLTDTRLARLVHRLDRSPHRILAPQELRGGLSKAGLFDVTVERSARDHLMRFTGIKGTA